MDDKMNGGYDLVLYVFPAHFRDSHPCQIKDRKLASSSRSVTVQPHVLNGYGLSLLSQLAPR